MTRQARKRRGRVLRSAGIGIVVLLVIIFVLNNSQHVDVRFWGYHSQPRLIWVIAGCLAIGGAVGYLVGRPGRRARPKKADKDKS